MPFSRALDGPAFCCWSIEIAGEAEDMGVSQALDAGSCRAMKAVGEAVNLASAGVRGDICTAEQEDQGLCVGGALEDGRCLGQLMLRCTRWLVKCQGLMADNSIMSRVRQDVKRRIEGEIY